MSQSEIRPAEVAPGLLVSVLQKGLQYSALEHHINEDGSEKKCGKVFNLLQVHVCDEEPEEENEKLAVEEVSVGSNEISQAVDSPLQSSLSNLNLALQNASIMATNAVYGNIGNSSSGSNNNNNAKTVTNNTSSSSSTTPSNKKKKTKEAKAVETTSSSTKVVVSSSSDVEMKDVVEVKTEEGVVEGGLNDDRFVEEEIVELVGHQSEVIGCAWNPQNEHLLASASGDSTVRLWTFPTSASGLYEVNPRTVNKNVKVLEHVLIKDAGKSSDVTCLEWRADGGALATGCYDGKARIWSAQGDLQRTLQKHTGPIFAARWNPAGRLLLTCGIDGLAIVWDVEGGGVRNLLQHHSAACLDADWRNEAEFVTSGSDKLVHFYDLSQAPAEGTGEAFHPALTLTGHTDEVNTVKFDPTQQFLATCSDDSTVRIWRVLRVGQSNEWQGECLHVLTAHTKEVYTLKWSPVVDSGVFASASFDCSVRVWKLSGSESGSGGSEITVKALNGHTQAVYSIAFSPCGRFLASGSLDGSVLIWSVQSGSLLKTYSAPNDGGFFDLEWRGNWIAASNSQGRVVVLEFNPDSVVTEVPPPSGTEDASTADGTITADTPADIVDDDVIVAIDSNSPTETPAEIKSENVSESTIEGKIEENAMID